MKFIHFGCWNHGFCNMANPENGLSITMKKLNEYVVNDKIDFITIAGDNYYPDKKETKINDVKVKRKYFNQDNFNSGLDCLPKGIKKYVILGNHEIEDLVITPLNDDVQMCYSLLKQQEYESKNNNFDLFNNIINFKIDNDSTLVIMIDTTLYELQETTKSDQPLEESCYKYLFKDVSANKIIDLINYQENEILRIIEKNNTIKNLIFVAHHPIASMTFKISKTKDKIEYNKRLCDFIMAFNYNIYYLCADTHLYQHGIINEKINQYIVGTGGAEQDMPSSKHEFNENGINYKIIENKKEFGFIVVNIVDGVVDIEFINATDVHGGSRDYLIHKINKYMGKINNIRS